MNATARAARMDLMDLEKPPSGGDANSRTIPNDPDSLHPYQAGDLRRLASLPLFSGLPEAALADLVGRLHVLDLADRQVLFLEGEPGANFYLVCSGQVEILKALDTPDERLLGVHGEGDFIGELSLLNPDGLRTASVRARGQSRLWLLSHQVIDALLHRHPSFAYDLMRMISERLSQSQAEMFASLREKNRQLLQAYNDLLAAQEQILEKERLERELQVAHTIQMSILPHRLPETSEFEFGASIFPARAVGGDFYDVFPAGPNTIAVLIGDVADKGVPSAIFMARVHAFVCAEAAHYSSAGQVLRRVNTQLLQEDQSSLFVTVLLGLLDLPSGRFTYARAGHERPLIVPRDGEACLADWTQGQPLGFMEDLELDEQVLDLNSTELLLLYTDGVTDGRSPQGETFGYERLLEITARLRSLPAQQLCDQLMAALRDFKGSAAQDDDLSLLVIRPL
jgi:phosphoserine phosphatase RsbU/P